MNNILKKSLYLLALLTVDQINCHQLFIQSVSSKNQNITIDYEDDWTIKQIYDAAAYKLEVSPENIKLILSGKILTNDQTPITHYNLKLVGHINYKLVASPAEQSRSISTTEQAGADNPATDNSEKLAACQSKLSELEGKQTAVHDLLKSALTVLT